MSKGLGIVLAIVGVLVVVVLMVFGSFVSAKNQMAAGPRSECEGRMVRKWMGVERRADLIPNLVETVMGFTKEESTVYGDIAYARAGMLNAQGPAPKIAANGQLDGALGRLATAYGKLSAIAFERPVHAVAGRTAGNGNRISVARKRYKRCAAGLQHIHSASPEEHLSGDGGLFAEHGLLYGQARRRSRFRT